ncbi:uncharacterized protein HD556DRAFT_1310160 [Suillus plorans]|uniref:Uncharacterized protein n=1 Tax=Suillus plorans TaxID=116603 RepID=A0A9P7ALM1_9AGAM|nr:uncharacterized protein HD556DRAFT_1310160 [Suillus plorans]KAG1791056.1 hypothetical protein HD556DRAFT_1310160 [Suillus plorans]
MSKNLQIHDMLAKIDVWSVLNNGGKVSADDGFHLGVLLDPFLYGSQFCGGGLSWHSDFGCYTGVFSYIIGLGYTSVPDLMLQPYKAARRSHCLRASSFSVKLLLAEAALEEGTTNADTHYFRDFNMDSDRDNIEKEDKHEEEGDQEESEVGKSMCWGNPCRWQYLIENSAASMHPNIFMATAKHVMKLTDKAKAAIEDRLEAVGPSKKRKADPKSASVALNHLKKTKQNPPTGTPKDSLSSKDLTSPPNMGTAPEPGKSCHAVVWTEEEEAALDIGDMGDKGDAADPSDIDIDSGENDENIDDDDDGLIDVAAILNVDERKELQGSIPTTHSHLS